MCVCVFFLNSLYDAVKKIQQQRLSHSLDGTTPAAAVVVVADETTAPSPDLATTKEKPTSSEISIEANNSNEGPPSREGSLTFTLGEPSEKIVFKTLNELEKEIFDVGTPGREYRRGSRILLGINSSESTKQSKDDSSIVDVKTSANGLQRRSSRADEFKMNITASNEAVTVATSTNSREDEAERILDAKGSTPEIKLEELLLSTLKRPNDIESHSRGSTMRTGSDSKRLRRVHSEPFYFSWAYTISNHSGSSASGSYVNVSASEPNQATNTESQPQPMGFNSLRACNSCHRIPTLLFNAEGELQVVEDDDDQNVKTAYEAVSRKPSKGASVASFLAPSEKKEEKGRSISVDYTNASITPRRNFSVPEKEESTEQSIHCVSVEGKKVVISGTVDQLLLHLYDPREVQREYSLPPYSQIQ